MFSSPRSVFLCFDPSQSVFITNEVLYFFFVSLYTLEDQFFCNLNDTRVLHQVDEMLNASKKEEEEEDDGSNNANCQSESHVVVRGIVNKLLSDVIKQDLVPEEKEEKKKGESLGSSELYLGAAAAEGNEMVDSYETSDGDHRGDVLMVNGQQQHSSHAHDETADESKLADDTKMADESDMADNVAKKESADDRIDGGAEVKKADAKIVADSNMADKFTMSDESKMADADSQSDSAGDARSTGGHSGSGGREGGATFDPELLPTVHPLHTHILLYTRKYDSKRTLYALQCVKAMLSTSARQVASFTINSFYAFLLFLFVSAELSAKLYPLLYNCLIDNELSRCFIVGHWV